MGRPINKKYFGNLTAPYDDAQTGGPTGQGGEGIASFTIGGTNNNYTSKPTVSSIGAPTLGGGVQAVAGAILMTAKTATVGTSGTGATTADYVVGDILTVSGGTGTAATFTVATTKVRTIAVQAGGTTVWTTGDTVTFSTGFSTPAVITITAAAGAITSLTVTNAGVRTAGALSDPVAPNSAVVADGGGYQNDATFNIGLGVNAVTLLSGGSYSILPSNPVATTTNSANGTGATLSVNYGVLSIAVGTAGSGYTAAPTVTLSGGNASVTAVLGTAVTNAIKVTAYIPVADGGTSALEADIMKQEGTKRYLVRTTEGQGICILTAAASGALTAGQMNLIATDTLNSTYYVTKLTSRRAKLTQAVNGGGGFEFANGAVAGWSLAAASTGVVSIANA